MTVKPKKKQKRRVPLMVDFVTEPFTSNTINHIPPSF